MQDLSCNLATFGELALSQFARLAMVDVPQSPTWDRQTHVGNGRVGRDIFPMARGITGTPSHNINIYIYIYIYMCMYVIAILTLIVTEAIIVNR